MSKNTVVLPLGFTVKVGKDGAIYNTECGDLEIDAETLNLIVLIARRQKNTGEDWGDSPISTENGYEVSFCDGSEVIDGGHKVQNGDVMVGCQWVPHDLLLKVHELSLKARKEQSA